MRYKIIVLVLLTFIIGCRQSSNLTDPGKTPPASTSDSLNGIIYTFAVSKDTLGILDTLAMTMTAFNQTAVQETLYVSDYFFTWSLTDGNGKVIASGPKVLSNIVIQIPLNPHQSRLLYGLKYSMADLFSAPIEAETYSLQWKLSYGLSFQLNLLCGKSENEILDSTGITSPIYPLKVGNKWTFCKKYVFPGTVIAGDTVTRTIVGETMINGEKWFLLRSTDYVDQLITARQDGIYVYYSDINAAVLRYKYPDVMGEQYTSGYEEWTGELDTLITFSMTVDSLKESISVPGGKYQCYKYHAPEVDATFGSTTSEIGSEDVFLSNAGPVREVAGNAYTELLCTNF